MYVSLVSLLYCLLYGTLNVCYCLLWSVNVCVTGQSAVLCGTLNVCVTGQCLSGQLNVCVTGQSAVLSVIMER